MNNKPRWGVIINPAAGSGYAGKTAHVVREKITSQNIEADIVFTEGRGHASSLAEQFAQKGYTHVVAVGGDGTFNETVNGLINYENIIFGAISAGTGNDFIQILGFSDHFQDSDWEIFFQQHITPMDVGKCNETYFVNGMGLGFDAEVAAKNYKDGELVKGVGARKYLMHILETLFFFKENRMRVHTEENHNETKVFINTIANGRRFAGGYFLTPKAFANDGLFDVCMVDELSLLQRFKIFLKVPKGTHVGDKKVNYYQTNKLIIEFDNEVPHHLDGELFFAQKFEVTIHPRKIQTIYNPHSTHYFSF